MNVDSHDAQVSDFNRHLRNKVATSILEYSLSPKPHSGYDYLSYVKI